MVVLSVIRVVADVPLRRVVRDALTSIGSSDSTLTNRLSDVLDCCLTNTLVGSLSDSLNDILLYFLTLPRSKTVSLPTTLSYCLSNGLSCIISCLSLSNSLDYLSNLSYILYSNLSFSSSEVISNDTSDINLILIIHSHKLVFILSLQHLQLLLLDILSIAAISIINQQHLSSS